MSRVNKQQDQGATEQANISNEESKHQSNGNNNVVTQLANESKHEAAQHANCSKKKKRKQTAARAELRSRRTVE